MADLDSDTLKARVAVSHVGCGWQFCSRARGGSIWFFRLWDGSASSVLAGWLSAGGS